MTKGKNNKKNSKPQKNKKNRQQPQVVYVKQPQLSIGAQIGDKLQKLGTSLFTRFMGTGDYISNEGAPQVKMNALIKGSDAKAVRMGSDKSTFIFEHSEYIGDVISSATPGAFSSTSYVCNPLNSVSFPWLANLAGSFETYEVVGLIYRFVSTSGDAVGSTNTALGTVMGTFVYDSMDPDFVSKQQMLQYDDTVSCKTSSNFICGVECDPSRLPTYSNKLYVGVPPQGADPKFYNFGNFVIATSGMQAASVTIGELYVNYVIRMHVTKDTNYVTGSAHVQTTTDTIWSVASQSGTVKAAFTNTLGQDLNIIGVQPGSRYMISISYSGPGGAYVVPTTYTISTATYDLVKFFDFNTSYQTGNAFGSFTASSASVQLVAQAKNSTMVLPNFMATTHPSGSRSDIFISELDGTILK